jgi:hypothetical protein
MYRPGPLSIRGGCEIRSLQEQYPNWIYSRFARIYLNRASNPTVSDIYSLTHPPTNKITAQGAVFYSGGGCEIRTHGQFYPPAV